MKYLTTLYALLLIISTVVILKLSLLYSCIVLCHKCGHRNIRGSVINGLTAFLILSYYQCVQITTMILTPLAIKGQGGKIIQYKALYDGRIDYMSYGHKICNPCINVYYNCHTTSTYITTG